MTRIGLIGYGYWGPNLARNFSAHPNVQLTWICDMRKHVLSKLPLLYPMTKTTTRASDVFSDPDTDAVVVATPISTHVPLARAALRARKHVLVEKPLAPTGKDAKMLVTLARKKRKILMVDHTYIYTPAVQKIKEIIASGELGKVFFIDSVRTNLGLVQADSNVIFDLATHDFAILDFLFGKNPTVVSATGFSVGGTREEAVAYVSARYGKELFLHTHVSWLYPIKIRTMIFVGTKKMLVFDDVEPSEKIKIYDKGISVSLDPKNRYQMRVGYRTGSVVSPHLPLTEALSGMAKEFIRAIEKNRKPTTDGTSGTNVVSAIEAATKSLRTGGKHIRL
ncbi:hypothetical protein A3A79_01885 [Candidatus Gottesmanbacteria bacterium RIFCSPLOWO2_01_FULL_43_11b]|uniref:Oxidoreductase n=1 Tax=Candidatus Gottesmanbacteria bacterium RIFCSPLOWO2_01_FULL_43_11b TaxID=1798392 RepID=A0A1F6AGX2_9BACT|nr:MAG: hypothetical protein A3A79_01885 [Candidatus Gottesmanbacteria bacterium RIFCSPLOWO2_01_FULL_43_11b]